MTEVKRTETLINKIRGRTETAAAGYLERGWVIANHKLVSFHAAFISSVLSLPVAHLKDLAEQGSTKIYVRKLGNACIIIGIVFIMAYGDCHTRNGPLPYSSQTFSIK